MTAARQQYGVNPVIFLGLIVACAPFFYYSIYRLVRAVAKKEKGRVALWSSVFLAATSLPYLYVLLFGRNLPWYIYGDLRRPHRPGDLPTGEEDPAMTPKDPVLFGVR